MPKQHIEDTQNNTTYKRNTVKIQYYNYRMENVRNWTPIAYIFSHFSAAQREKLITQWTKNLSHWVTSFHSWVAIMSSVVVYDGVLS